MKDFKEIKRVIITFLVVGLVAWLALIAAMSYGVYWVINALK